LKVEARVWKGFMELSYPKTFVPGNESSICRTFVLGNFEKFLGRMFQETKVLINKIPGTKVLRYEISSYLWKGRVKERAKQRTPNKYKFGRNSVGPRKTQSISLAA